MANDMINSLTYDGNIHTFTLPYGTCATAAGTAAKVVTDADNFALEKGARITVKFTYTNTAASPTLNVNNTGAKAIYYRGAALQVKNLLVADRPYDFVYNGTQWELMNPYINSMLETYKGTGGVTTDTYKGQYPFYTYWETGSTLKLQVDGYKTHADMATEDGNNNNIADTYIKDLSASGQTITFTKGDGDTGTITTQDQNVTQTSKGDNVNYPLLGAYSATPTSGTKAGTVYDTGIHMNPSTNTITATNFAGNATSADKLNSISLSEGDLNTLYENGKYKLYNLSSSGTYSNLPAGIPSGSRIALFSYPISSTSFGQELYVNNNKKYIRYSDGTTWYDWNVLVGMKPGTAIGNNTNKAIYLDTNGTPQSFTITPANIGAAPTVHNSENETYGKGTKSKFGHLKLSDEPSGAITEANGTAATPAAVQTVYDAAAILAENNSFSGVNTFENTSVFSGSVKLGPNVYGTNLPTENNVEGRIFFVEDNSSEVYGLPPQGIEGQYLVKAGSGDGVSTWVDLDIKATYNEAGDKSYLVGRLASVTDKTVVNYDTKVYSEGGYLYATQMHATEMHATTIRGTKVYGAVWNDYAEYRNQNNVIEPGYCVASEDNGKVYKTNQKFQACDGIVSDTFGFAIGETENCKTPLAVAGRVLAYCEGNREDYHAGDTVCAGPEGKVCKMTREEIREWPDRIIGIVSEIPQYETWGSNNTKVNGRIWIKIK